MLFIAIATYEPEKRNQGKLLQGREAVPPEGIKLIGEWNVIGGGKVFRLIHAEDHKAALSWALAWNKRCKIEMIPVIQRENCMKPISQNREA